jgi:hypothetical protein
MKTIYSIEDDLEVLSKMISNNRIMLKYSNNSKSNRLIIDKIILLKNQYLLTRYKTINNMKL